MADMDQSTAGVASGTDTSTGGTQGGQSGLSGLYDQLPKSGEFVRDRLNAERFSKLPKLENLVAEITRLDAEVGKGVRVPAKGASQAEWSAYRKAVGVPESAEGYRFQRPQLPQGMRYNEGIEKWFREKMHGANVPQEQAEAIFNDFNRMQVENYNQFQAQAQAQRQKDFETGKATLQKEFGDKFDEKMAALKRGIDQFLSPKAFEKLKRFGLDNDPDIVFAFVKVGESMAEDKLVAATDGGQKEVPSGLPRTRHGHTLEFPNMRSGYQGGARFPVRQE